MFYDELARRIKEINFEKKFIIEKKYLHQDSYKVHCSHYIARKVG